MFKKEIIIISFILMFIALFNIKRDELFVCKAKLNMCKISSVNMFNIEQSRYIFIADNIVGTKVEKYRKVRRRRHRSPRTLTRYRLIVIDKSGKTSTIFDDYSYESLANNTGVMIMKCLRNENYPCVFKKYHNE